MRPWSGLVGVCLVAGLLGRSAGAAPIPEVEADIAVRFARGTTRDVAWAAWLAGENGLTAFGPDVVRSLRRPSVGEGVLGEAWIRDQVLLDAARRLAVDLERSVLVALAPSHPEAVVHHLLRRREPDLAAVFDAFTTLDAPRPTSLAWMALGDHLARAQPPYPGFAPRLLSRLRVERDVSVYDPDDTSTSASPPPGGSVRACGCAKLPQGFPPVPRLFFSYEWDEGLRGEDWERLGRTRVVVQRRVVRDGEWGVGTSLEEHPEDAALVRDWLGVRRLAPADAGALAAKDHWSLDWMGRQRWNRFLQPRVDAAHAAYWRLIDALVARGALSVARARDALPEVRVEVVDCRRDTHLPLPPVPPSAVPNPRLPRPVTTVRRGV